MTTATPIQTLVRALVLACCFLACCQLLAIAVFGQTASATLSGTVEDENGALIPNAAVTAINTGTALQRDTTTDERGHYVLPLLPPGTYIVRVQAQGFATVENSNVVLNVGDQKALQIQLKAGNISEMVKITGEAPLIDTNPAVGTVVDRQFVENIPLNGRSFQSLIALTPGVVTVPAPGPANFSGQFSVNGQRASANSFMVDGVSANFAAVAEPTINALQTTGNLPSLTTFGTTQSLVSVDALQEFRVQTSGYSAEYGRQPGGQISIVTRSGTKNFHGSVFDYIRNDIFDANNWFANANRRPKPPLRQNDFGGTFSGPVLLPRFGEGGKTYWSGRNKTFFFFSYEGLRLRLPKFSLTNVPTLALRQQASAGLQPILNAFPVPNGRDLGNGLAEFSASYSDPSSLDAASIRLDHTVNSKFTLFGRYNRAPSSTSARRSGLNLSAIQSSRLTTQTLTLGVTALLTTRAINDLRVNYSSNRARFSINLDNFGGAAAPPRIALIPSQYDSSTAQGAVGLSFSGRTSSGIPRVTLSGAVTDQHQVNIVDNFSYSVGSHQFKFGFDYRRLSPIADVNRYFLSVTFRSLQQVLAATAGFVSIEAAVPGRPIIVNLSAYGQDTWKFSRRLTLDLGLRWDVNPAPREASGNDQLAVNQINNLATMDLAPQGTRAWKTTYNNFAPRIGVAYLLSQTPGREMVLRGGLGVFYDAGNDWGAQNFNRGYPFAASRTVSNLIFPPSSTQVSPPPLPVQTAVTPPYGSFSAFDPNLKLPYTLQWNVAMERSLGASQTLTASYVGAAGRRLLQNTRLSLNSINPRFTSVDLITNKATSDYHAMQTSFQRRLSKGLQALVSYTWSHSLDDDSTSSTGFVARRGNAAFDVRHLFADAATYDIPKPSFGSLLNTLLSRWSLDTNFHVQSAPPVDLVADFIFSPVDGSFINVRPNVNPGVSWYVNDPTVPGGRRINSAAFSMPTPGQSGNFGRNQVRGLPAWQVDFAIRREFRLREKLKMQFRAEAFNIFNHPNFGTIQTFLGTPNFGQATDILSQQLGGLNQLYQIGGPRSFQFAVKLVF